MAKKNRTYDLNKLGGLSIYHDDKRTVYSPFFTDKAYIITEKNVDDYIGYTQGYLLGLVIFTLAFFITRNVWISIGLGLVFIISTTAVFYFSFIKKAGVIEHYNKKEKDSFIIRQAKTLDERNLKTIIIACPLLSLMVMVNAWINHFNGTMLYLSIIIALVVLIYCGIHIYALNYKRKNNL